MSESVSDIQARIEVQILKKEVNRVLVHTGVTLPRITRLIQMHLLYAAHKGRRKFDQAKQVYLEYAKRSAFNALMKGGRMPPRNKRH